MSPVLPRAPRLAVGIPRLLASAPMCSQLHLKATTSVQVTLGFDHPVVLVGQLSDTPSGSQRLPESPRESQRVPESPRESQRVPESPRESQRVPESPRESQRVPATKIHFAEVDKALLLGEK
jgi:hypothetical protein